MGLVEAPSCKWRYMLRAVRLRAYIHWCNLVTTAALADLAMHRVFPSFLPFFQFATMPVQSARYANVSELLIGSLPFSRT